MPAIPAIIGAAGTIGGALIGRKKSGEEKAGLAATTGRAEVETQAGEWGLGEAKRLLPKGEESIEQALSYYLPLLSGDRQAMMEAMGPEVNQIVSQYDTGRRAAAEFTPRGGGRTTALAELPFRKAGAITSLLQGARPGAAKAVSDIGFGVGDLASRLLPGSTGAGAQLLGYALQRRGQDIPAWEKMGTSIGSLIYDIWKKATTKPLAG